MTRNLYRPEWADLDQGELRLILLSRIGPPGQYDGPAVDPVPFYLPLAREKCQVKLLFAGGKRLVAIEPGPAFDPARWKQVENDVARSGTPMFGRDVSFSSFRVVGSWSGKRSGLQILPAPATAPVAPVEMAEHAFILEFPMVASDDFQITNYRRRQTHRELTLLLNVLLAGRTNSHVGMAKHLWAIAPGEGPGADRVKWVQEFYFADIGEIWLQEPSAPSEVAIAEVEPGAYYGKVGHDGLPLRVPSDLDDSICTYLELRKNEALRKKFAIAAFWMDMASSQWTLSFSASFASLAIACEALGERNLRPTARFKKFIERYAPGASLAEPRTAMYGLRSEIMHGSGLIEMDRGTDFGWAPPEQEQKDLLAQLWGLARIAMRNWIKDPSGI